MKYSLPLLMLSCSTVSSAPQNSPTSAGALLAPVSAPVGCVLPAPEAELAAIRGWGVLRLGMSPIDASLALKAAQIEYKVEVTHGYFSPPPGGSAQPVSHSSDEAWRFSCQGWSGLAKLNDAHTAIDSISVESPFFDSEAEAKTIFDVFEQNLGAPQTQTYAYPEVSRIDHCWKNQRLNLCVLLIQSKQNEQQVWQVIRQYNFL